MLFTYAPAAERARRVLSKLRQAPRLIQAARDNIKDPPGIFVKVGIETMRGALTFIDDDLPRALSDVDDLHLLGELADAQAEASQAVRSYVHDLENEIGPKARGSFRLGREKFEQKLKLDEGVTVPIDRLLAIATRELESDAGGVQEPGRPHERRQSARSLGAHQGPASEAGRARGRRPAAARGAGHVPRAAGAHHDPARASRLPLRPTPDFYRWSFASMWTPGPFEAKPTRAYYYLTDVDPSWSPERQDEHLRDYNYPTLWSISIHEVYPGHFLQFQHLRRVESKVRKSIMFAPASFVEGWAHYCEEMMMDAGFGRQDYSVKLGQLAEALIRLARFIVCIRMHAEDMSVEQAVRFFRDEAFMEEGSARREAERGTFDPMYLVYSVGKLMLMKLRQRLQTAARQGVFAPHVSRHPARPGHRALLAPSSTDAGRRRCRRSARMSRDAGAGLKTCATTARGQRVAQDFSPACRGSRNAPLRI